MTSLRRSLELPYRPEDLFNLASDVGRYPDFVKWIRRLRLLDEQTFGDTWKGRAEATVGFLAFTEMFVTDIVAKRDAMSIEVALVRGPFRKLRNTWRFAPSAFGAKVDFTIDFEFRNFVLQAVAEANRDHAVSSIIDAFTAEAARRYPKTVTPV